MKCPRCDNNTYVIDTRSIKKSIQRRRYKCNVCLFRFSTHEVLVSYHVNLQKKINIINDFKKLMVDSND